MSTEAVRVEDWVEDWERSVNDARLFVTNILGVTPDPWQAEALDAISKENRVAVRSGHGVGKTALISWIVLCRFAGRRPSGHRSSCDESGDRRHRIL